MPAKAAPAKRRAKGAAETPAMGRDALHRAYLAAGGRHVPEARVTSAQAAPHDFRVEQRVQRVNVRQAHGA